MKRILAGLLLLCSSSALADGFASEDELRTFTDQLMSYFVASDFKQGLNSVKPFWPIPEIEVDNLAMQIREQWNIVDQRFGQAVGQEFVKEKRIGDSFVRYYYLHKFENHAIYWQFDSYRATDEWQLNSIVFLDSLDVLYE